MFCHSCKMTSALQICISRIIPSLHKHPDFMKIVFVNRWNYLGHDSFVKLHQLLQSDLIKLRRSDFSILAKHVCVGVQKISKKKYGTKEPFEQQVVKVRNGNDVSITIVLKLLFRIVVSVLIFYDVLHFRGLIYSSDRIYKFYCK